MMTAVGLSDFFPPTDRELALRGVIHTGWSTVAAKQPRLEEHHLPPEELTVIKDVLQRAEAMEKMEEIRVGIFMLKHKQLVDSCRGDGVGSCRICGINFSSPKGDQQRPSGVQLCHICQKGVCQRCKSFSKSGKGDLQILCQVCADQKELWKRSGAWLNNVLPSVSFSDNELLKVQEQQEVSHNRTLTLRSVGSLPRAFINPARLDSSDDTDEDEIEVPSSIEPQLNFTAKQPSEGSPLPSLNFMKELHPRKDSSLPECTATLPRSFGTTSKETTPVMRSHSTSRPSPPRKESSPPRRTKSQDDVSKDAHRVRKLVDEEFRRGSEGSSGRGVSRRAAISSKNKSGMEESRRRAKLKRDSRSPSSASGNEGTVGDRSSSCKEESTASPSPVHVPSLPQIKLRRPTDPAVEQFFPEPQNIEKDNVFEKSTGNSKGPTSSREENTPTNTPVKTDFKKVSVVDKADSLIYSTVEFSKTPKKTVELFAKVTPKKTATISDIPRDTTVVHYSQVDFTKTKPKPVIKDDPEPDEFVKVKTGKVATATTITDPKTPRRMTTITEETSPPVPRRRREPQADTANQSPVDTETNPRIPTRSASLKKKELSENETPPPLSARVVPPIPAESAETTKPSTVPRTLPSVTTPPTTPPVPRARGRKPSDETKPLLPLKESSFKRTVPPLPSKDNTTVPRPPLPPKEENSPKPPLPMKEDTRASPKIPLPPLPAKDDSPGKPPLPAKDKVLDMPPLPPKEDSFEKLNVSSLSRTGNTRSTISNKTVMGNLLEEIRKKQTRVQPISQEPETNTQEPSKIDPSKLSSSDFSSPEAKKSPGNSPLRRRNAARTTRMMKSRPESGEDATSLSIAGDDLPDEEENQFQFRRRSSAVRRGRPRAIHSMPDTTTPEPQLPEMSRARTRSSAVSGMERPVRRGGRSPDMRRPSGEDVPRPQSHSAAPDGLCGSIEVCLQYEETSSTLTVTVLRCKGLRPMDANGFSDPYVNLFLVPGHKMHDVQTDIQFKTLNPEYEESFTFERVSKESLSERKLYMVVMDYDEFSKDDFIGGTRVNLYELLVAQSNCLTIRRLLDDKKVPNHRLREKQRGKIELMMKYSTKTETFTVHVIKADQLLNYGTKETNCDPFAKCHIQCKGKILKRKTSTCLKTINPAFNEELHFSIRLQDLPFCRMTITVKDHKKLKNIFLGEIHFDSISFWRNFMAQPDQDVWDWYELKAPGSHKTPTYAYAGARRSSNVISRQVKQLMQSVPHSGAHRPRSSSMYATRIDVGGANMEREGLSSRTEEGSSKKTMSKYQTLPGRIRN